ncbi:MAG: hypothetical protein KBD16_01015 [Candidatus Pacebacteria bacterium]|nr:hypothetical protein [Candidatus Paceibacterota bacterium]
MKRHNGEYDAIRWVLGIVALTMVFVWLGDSPMRQQTVAASYNGKVDVPSVP